MTASPLPESGEPEPALDLDEINRLSQRCIDFYGESESTIYRLATQSIPALTNELSRVVAERNQLRTALAMVAGEFKQAKGRDGIHAPYYAGTLDFPQMDHVRSLLSEGGTDE